MSEMFHTTVSVSGGYLCDGAFFTQAEREEVLDDEYEKAQASDERPGYFGIRPEILRTATRTIHRDSNNASEWQAQSQESQIQTGDVLVPEDGNTWHQGFGETNGSVWANALRPISGNQSQPKHRSARVAKKTGYYINGSVVPKPVIKKQSSILSLPSEILDAVVKKIPGQHNLILFTLTCKTFATTAFKIYPADDSMWVFDDWEGFEDDYNCNRSEFLLSQPLADWMPLDQKYCRHCDKWTSDIEDSADRKKGEYDDLVHPCLLCRSLKDEHRNHFHPEECDDLDTCARYSDWDGGTPKKKRWAENAWHPDLVDFVVHPDLAHSDEEDLSDSNDSDEEEEEEWEEEEGEESNSDEEGDDSDDDDSKCRTCRAGLCCGKH